MIDVKLEYIRRIKLLDQIKKNPRFAALETEMCRRDPIHFINNWCLTFDPRVSPKHFPFNLYEYQLETIKWLDDRYKNKENGLIEKSRDLGATWMVSAWAVHKWLFDTGFSCLFGSRKEDLVDNQTLDSIFGKLRYIIYRLPAFLRPKISERSKHDRYLSIVNPNNDNAITGESANIGFGRGGRSSVCFLDEFAHIQHSEAVWASISDNTDCVIALSTPNGMDNQFAWLRHKTKIKTLSLHWSKHPHKNQEWYESRKQQMKPWQIAQELDLSYERSLEGRVHNRFDRAYHVAPEVIECNPNYEQFVAWDFGIADPTAIIWGQITTDGIIQIWNCFELANQDIDFFIPLVTKAVTPREYHLLNSDDKHAFDKALNKVPRGIDLNAYHYGDHAGTARTANSRRTCRDALKENGIKLHSTGRQTFDVRIEAVDQLLKLRYNNHTKKWYSIVQVSPDCERFIECMFNYVYDSQEVNDNNIKPKHNWASHLVTAFEFFAINRFPVSKPQKSYSTRIR